MVEGLILRPASAADAEALATVYGWHVLNGVGTFEEVPPDAAEMGRRVERVQAAALPYLVAEVGGEVAGFASAGPYNARSGYRFTVEDSVYLSPAFQRRGLGRALLSAVLEACAARDVRRVVALIGDSGNTASIALHRALGFEPAGTLREIGFKHGRWLDVVLMQRSLTDSPRTAIVG
jgi:phosphinothricin acetyltransferase